MVDLMAQLFAIVGVDLIPPTNLAEFFPYYFKIILAVGIVAVIFRFIFSFSGDLIRGRFV